MDHFFFFFFLIFDVPIFKSTISTAKKEYNTKSAKKILINITPNLL